MSKISEIKQRLAEKPNIGHGHVFPRADGSRARCGGPGLCNQCSREQSEVRGLPDIILGPDGLVDASVDDGPSLFGSTSDGDRPDLEPYEVQLDTSGDPDDNYFPVCPPMMRDLIGKMLTHIDALGLPEGQAKANKDLVRQTIFNWFGDVKDNSLTSYRGCLAPIQVLRHDDTSLRKYVWLAVGDHAVSVG